MIQSNLMKKSKSGMHPTKVRSLYFNNGPDGPAFVLPEITALSPVTNSTDYFPNTRPRTCYRVYMVNLSKPITFIFNNIDSANRSREQLTYRLLNFWGNKKVLFTNGWSGWITVISAIRSISGISLSSDKAFFSVSVSNVDSDLVSVFDDNAVAQQRRFEILSLIEELWIDQNRSNPTLQKVG